MRDPYRIDGPAVLSVSGGRSSMMMLSRILDAHGGRLPADVHALYTNTGRERAETLRFVADCAERWGVAIAWAERDGSQPSGARFREVEYETASREGEPFAELITERRYLPNAVARFCTVALKIEVMRDWMRAQGHDRWTNVVGLRRDEPARVAKLRARDHGQWDVAAPLYDARVTSADVAAFWKAQPFDLALRPWEGNCDGCFLKSRSRRERIFRDRPDLAAWWIAQEAAVGGRFHAHEPGYAATLDRVRRLPMLALDLDASADDGTPACGCTDRRPTRARWCICGSRKPPGRQHTLACQFARADAARAA